MTYLVNAMISALFFAPPTNLEDFQIDYQAPLHSEIVYTFVCARQQTRLRVVEEFQIGDDSVPLADRRRIRLVGLELGGRTIPAALTHAASEALHRYSWLTRVRGLCGGRSMRIEVSGMGAEAWATHVLADPRGPRPAETGNAITIEQAGRVSVE